MSDLDQNERTRIAENARRKLLANKAVNHPDSEVHIDERVWTMDGRQTLHITVYLPPEA
jgi:hypothetical protein